MFLCKFSHKIEYSPNLSTMVYCITLIKNLLIKEEGALLHVYYNFSIYFFFFFFIQITYADVVQKSYFFQIDWNLIRVHFYMGLRFWLYFSTLYSFIFGDKFDPKIWSRNWLNFSTCVHYVDHDFDISYLKIFPI